MSFKKVLNYLLNIKSSDALTDEGQLRIDGSDFFYHDGLSEVLVGSGGGGGGPAIGVG